MIVDEDAQKDQKIYDIYKQAMEAPNLNHKLRVAYVLSFQLEKKHTDRLPADFDITQERVWILESIKNIEIHRQIELRFKVTESQEGYKYFDKIMNDNPNDVWNYNEDCEKLIIEAEAKLLFFFAQIVKTLDIGIDFEDLIK
jgi:hypothetical protein